MLSRFFIDHPVFASVIAWVTVLFGVVALYKLPVEQYPQITPPTVRVSTNYPGANAKVVADTVAAPIEQQVNGVENMLYMSSTSSNDGSYALTITFEIGTDLNEAQMLVQNRVAISEPQLPDEVRRQGLTIKKQSTSILQVISLFSPDDRFDSLFLANYATLRLRDELSRVSGVGEVTVSGAGSYGMRIWLDPNKLKAYGITTQDVVRALQEQNVQVAAGVIGQPPTPPDQQFQYTVTTLGRLSDPKQFETVTIKTGANGQSTFLKDVARVELGGQNYDTFSASSGKFGASLLVYQLPGSNALSVVEGVDKAMKQLGKQMPEGMEWKVRFDTTRFVGAAIHEVYQTLLEAGVLVLIVILVFLQSWRAMIIPATTVPVTLLGAFAVLPLMGFTINLLTLFGLVLAIGIVVDDAIVIVENAMHHVEQGLSPRDATIKAMDEVTGPVIGITLVLLAVFLPATLLGGITGRMYQQFALTIAATTLISALNALTLKPVQAAAWLRRPSEKKGWFSRTFDFFYKPVERAYTAIIRGLVRVPALMLLLFVGITAGAGWWYQQIPRGFLPTEDQGYVVIQVQLPDAASLERTRGVVEEVDKVLKRTPGVEEWNTLGGFSVFDGANASNAATYYVTLTPWDERRTAELSLPGILRRLTDEFAKIQEAIVLVFPPPPILGLGPAGGFQIQIEDREAVGLQELEYRVQDVIDLARKAPEIGQINTTFRSGVPQYFIDINREKVKRLKLQLTDVFDTLQGYLGSIYVNDFNKFGRTYQVRVQADAQYRSKIEDLRQLEVRNAEGRMIPLTAILTAKRVVGPQFVNRYNLYPSATLSGNNSRAYSSGQAITRMEQIADEILPTTMGYEWTGLAFQEKRVAGQEFGMYALAVLLVYLVLAAQYESWILPWAVILVVPLGVLGAVAALWLRRIDNDVYAQIGVVLIIALASKNAILIVEFARDLYKQGRTRTEAAVEAARMRFRPILMTSIAFIMGVTPLVWATGAGATSRRSLGTAVFGGMIASTVLAIFFVPVFYVTMQWLAEKLRRKTIAN
jgi:HAE1 family hydrophobic/amphiphilic exporter-1